MFIISYSKRGRSKVRLFILLLTIFIFSFSTALLFISYTVLEVKSSCDGIEYFYSNTTFNHDYNKIKDVIKNVEEISNGNDIIIQSPKNLIECDNESKCYINNWDCEDISHTYMCLSKLYNIDCFYYFNCDVRLPFKLKINNNYDFNLIDICHIGLKCFVDGKKYQVN